MDRKPKTVDRRDKLIHAASQLIQRQGYARTTLAEIAEAGDVPLGSVYYYFKSKDEVLVAIIDRRVKGLRHLLVEGIASAGPRERLEALIQIWVTDKDIDTLYGCPIGSLCYELAKQREASGETTAKPLRFLLQWAEDQFRQMGRGEESPADALHVITVLQGASLVACIQQPSSYFAGNGSFESLAGKPCGPAPAARRKTLGEISLPATGGSWWTTKQRRKHESNCNHRITHLRSNYGATSMGCRLCSVRYCES